jgi:hypothetical protein
MEIVSPEVNFTEFTPKNRLNLLIIRGYEGKVGRT